MANQTQNGTRPEADSLDRVRKTYDNDIDGFDIIVNSEQGKWHTLQNAARSLEIDVKTLKRRLEVLEIEPTESAFDRRKLLISDDDLRRVEDASRRNAAKTGEGNMVRKLLQLIDQLQHRLDLQESLLKELQARIDQGSH